MKTCATRSRWILALVLLSGLSVGLFQFVGPATPGSARVLVVMDPLAKQLACACVLGYAQRNYAPLAEHLARQTGQPWRVVFSEDLDKVLREIDPARVALIVGKESVVDADTKAVRLSVRPLARLSGKDGKTTQTGLFVVKTKDPARNLADLKGRRILFGSPDAEEKHGAALTALRAAGVEVPAEPETRAGCSDAALDVQDSQAEPAPAAVISSYALPLLEGCGSIDKGSLRVLAETAPVPFIAAFATPSVDAAAERRIADALLAVRESPSLLAALESKEGFVPVAAGDWPDWRGPNRNGLAASLPISLPSAPRLVWKRPLTGAGLAGIAAAGGFVVVASRDLPDERDRFLCLRASDGTPVWTLDYPAPGKLDYGQSPRANPVIRGAMVYVLGAFGDLHCLALADGKILWKTNLLTEFNVKPPKWGTCSPPLIVEDKLIVNPGARKASVVALDRHTGKVLWAAAGNPAAYSAFIAGRFGGRVQIVGYDAISLGGWDVRTGRRLWALVPPNPGDFNVPTPVTWEGKLIVSTENNGTRLYGFDSDGKILPKPLAECAALAPDVNSPVVMNGRLLGCQGELLCLDLARGLKPIWTASDPAFSDFVSLIGADDRLLASTHRGELLLLSTGGERCQIVSRLRLFDAESEIYSHPALVGDRLFIRDNASICCFDLKPDVQMSAGL